MYNSLRLFSLVAVLFSVVGMEACSSSKKLAKQQNMLIGTWKLDAASVNGTTLPASMFDGDVVLIFKGDGTTSFTTFDGVSESGRYELKDNKIYYLDAPNEAPVEIISLEASKLVLKMIEKESEITMSMSRK